MEVDIERLRNDLINFYSSLVNFDPKYKTKLSKIKKTSSDEIIRIAVSNEFDLTKYKKAKDTSRDKNE